MLSSNPVGANRQVLSDKAFALIKSCLGRRMGDGREGCRSCVPVRVVLAWKLAPFAIAGGTGSSVTVSKPRVRLAIDNHHSRHLNQGAPVESPSGMKGRRSLPQLNRASGPRFPNPPARSSAGIHARRQRPLALT
jgi:hypothetical protein